MLVASEIKEELVKRRIKVTLKQHGAYWHMPVQRGRGAPALDFHVCHKGRYLGIEAKRPGNKPTPRQNLIMEQIIEAGGDVLVIGMKYDEETRLFEGEEELRAWLLR